MVSMLVRFALLVIAAALFAWLAEQPGSLQLTWMGYEIETSVLAAAVAVAALSLVLWIVWSLAVWVLGRPGALGHWLKDRRRRKGRAAVSSGMIAVAAGDSEAARRHAATAVSILGDDPLARLLDAQAAQMRGDYRHLKRLFKDMLEVPETRLLGLRGLYGDARQAGDEARARALAEEAARLNPALGWASSAVLAAQSADGDWAAVAATIDSQRQVHLIDGPEADRKRAVVLTAEAIAAEASDPTRALDLALRAHRLDPALVPAAALAGRLHAAAGHLRKAAKILEKTWTLTPHPDLAAAYAHARPGDSARDRLERVRDLVRRAPGGEEGAVAVAVTAVEARDWAAAREALRPWTQDRPRARVCSLMAEIEEAEFGDRGRTREWLARAVRAPRDPAWTADGHVSDRWQPASPVTGELGAFAWKVPVEAIGYAAEPDLPEPAIEEIEDQAPAVEEIEEVTPVEPVRAPDPPQPAPASPPPAAPAPAPATTETRLTVAATPLRQPDDPGPDVAEEPPPAARSSWV